MLRRIVISSVVLIYAISSIVIVHLKNTIPIRLKYDVIVVLGNAPNWNDKPNPFLKKRLDTGIKYLKKGYSNKILLTGGKKESRVSEADIMKNYCLKQGILMDNILLENIAKSTEENLIHSKSLMQNYNLEKALVITSSHHTKRVKRYCSVLELENFEVVQCESSFITIFLTVPLMIMEEVKMSK